MKLIFGVLYVHKKDFCLYICHFFFTNSDTVI